MLNLISLRFSFERLPGSIRGAIWTDATAVFPFDFARLPFTALIAYFAFAESPDGWS